MAVLEKIRKRSVLLFIIIIGALLAFILGDFLNSGRSLFGPGDTIASVGKTKVSQMDLNATSEQLENNLKQARATGQSVPAEYADPDYRYSQAVDAALYDKLMATECERLGIEVTDEFLSQFVANPGTAGYVWQTLISEVGGNPNETMGYLQSVGIVEPETYLDAIKNPARYRLEPQMAAGLTAAWQNMETNVAKNVQYQLYNQMLGALVQPNKADAKGYFEDHNNLSRVKVASVPFSTVNVADLTIEDADYEAIYNESKDAYRILDENREVAFIIVPIAASDEDYQLAENEAAALKAELALSEGIEAVLDHKGFSQQTLMLTDEDLSNNAQYTSMRLDSAGISKGSVHELFAPRGKKTLAKVLDVTTGINKVVFDMMPVENEVQADSLFAVKTPEAVDSVIRALTGGQFADVNMSLINPNPNFAVLTNSPKFNEMLTSGPVNEYVLVTDTLQGQPMTMAFLVKEREAAVPAYQIAIMNYDVYPSERTRQNLAQQLHNYVANHPTAEQFVNDSTGTYNALYSIISPNSTTIYSPQMTPATRSVVKWAMDAKKGAVSPVFTRQKQIYGRNGQPDESQDYLIAVAVTDVFDNYVPASSYQVHANLVPQAIANKQAQSIIEKYSGKGNNVDEYATAMGVTPQTMNVAFAAGTVGDEAQGKLAAANKGTFVGPVKGNNAVYVFEVEEVTTPDFDAVPLKTRLDEVASNIRTPQTGLDLLIGNRKVKNNSLLFTADATE
ncbi:MAG: SurA N-terminal domain-containing protein [Muribaculaceae bacterium]|nr:SurA N-terminal domain-containing protein [Muribaculaceae bacterium]